MFGGGRSGSRAGSKFRNGSKPGSKFRNNSKSQERPKSDLFKKVEAIEKELPALKKTINDMSEILKKSTINTKFVEEEIVIDIKYVEKDTENMMVIDSGAPVSLVSSAWFKQYVKEAKIDDEEIKKSSSARRFRLGKTLYISEQKVQFLWS